MTNEIILQLLYDSFDCQGLCRSVGGQFSIHIYDWVFLSVKLIGEDCAQVGFGGICVHQERL